MHLGYSIDTEHEETRREEFLSIFSKQAQTIDDEHDRATVDESRLNRVLVPDVQFLTKDNEKYISIKIGENSQIIVRDQVVLTRMGNGRKYEGFPIETYLIKGKNRNFLDLKSLVKKDTRQLISFSDRACSFASERFFVQVNETYPPDVFITVQTTKNETGQLVWDAHSTASIFLHENSHDICDDYHREYKIDMGMKEQKERDVNAVAIYLARTVNRKYPDDQFIDMSRLTSFIEHQLKTGYDPPESDPHPTDIIKGASNKLRWFIRDSRGKNPTAS